MARNEGSKRLQELNELGYRVRVHHRRNRISEDQIDLYGGSTLVLIHRRDDDSLLAAGAAICRPNERFDRHLGLTIAIGRAIKDLDAGVTKQLVQKGSFDPFYDPRDDFSPCGKDD